MGKHKSKTDRSPAYNLQAQERRSERQVVLNSRSDTNNLEPDVGEVIDNLIDDAMSVPPIAVVDQDMPTPILPEPPQVDTQTTSATPRSSTVVSAQPQQFSTSNVVVHDQVPSSSTAVPPPTQVNTDNSGPSRAEFLELKEQLAILTATLASINPSQRVVNDATVTIPTVNANHTGIPVPQVNSATNVPVHDTLIQTAVNNHIQNILSPTAQTGEVGSFQQANRSITLKVSESMKQAIWANQYIDLNKLIDHKLGQPQKVSYEFTGLYGQVPELTAKSPRVIGNLGMWCDAFMVFITIYCKKYPEQLDPLTSYMAQVKLLCSRGGDYLYYDQEFRYMRQSRNLPWDEVHSGLWLECRDRRDNNSNHNRGGGGRGRGSFRPQANNGGNSQKPRIPFGHCFAYHNRGECVKAGCPYAHKCFIEGCSGVHPYTRCPKYQGGNSDRPRGGNRPAQQGNNSSNPN